MLPVDSCIHSGAFKLPLYSFYREVETLTQEDRDIMDGSTFFRLFVLLHTSLWKKVAPDTNQGYFDEKNTIVDCLRSNCSKC